ncbi:MAG: hypothetical protein ACI350_08330 [Prevotella sp.]
MKSRLLLFLAFLLPMALQSCHNRQSAIDDLSGFVADVKKESPQYDDVAWDDVHAEFEVLCEALQEYEGEYTQEELKEIGRLKGAYAACYARYASKKGVGVLRNLMQQAAGMVRGFTEGVSDDLFDEGVDGAFEDQTEIQE